VRQTRDTGAGAKDAAPLTRREGPGVGRPAPAGERPERYSIAGGGEGKSRLDVLAAVMAPHTTALLDAVGVAPGARCLDVGCGGGHVALELARRAGPGGAVLAVDRDPEVLALARQDAAAEGVTTVRFQEGDARSLGTTIPGDAYDVVYARFLLSHVPDPAALAAGMAACVAPGGAVVVEDVDHRGCFCEPPNDGYRRYVELYQETVRRRGGDADLGPRLPALLRAAGLESLEVRIVQPVALTGVGKTLCLITLERIAAAVVAEGVASEAEVSAACADLRAFTADPTTLVAIPRIVQAWGRRP
jgi:SAM-dependent methyltransferase